MAIYECAGSVSVQGGNRLKCSVAWTEYTPPATQSGQLEITGELITRPAADALFSAVLGLWAIIFVFRALSRVLRF